MINQREDLNQFQSKPSAFRPFKHNLSVYLDIAFLMSAYHILTDQELVELLGQGDEQAFSCIYDRYWKVIFQSCYNRLRDREQSQDIVQNVFTSLWDRREKIKINNLPAYLQTAVKFQVLRIVSQAKRTKSVATFEELVTEPIEMHNQIEEREVLRLLQLFLDALPEKRRAIFIKRYREDYTTAQIAQELGITQKTVLNQLYNAEIALRIRLSTLLSLFTMTAFWLKK